MTESAAFLPTTSTLVFFVLIVSLPWVSVSDLYYTPQVEDASLTAEIHCIS